MNKASKLISVVKVYIILTLTSHSLAETQKKCVFAMKLNEILNHSVFLEKAIYIVIKNEEILNSVLYSV